MRIDGRIRIAASATYLPPTTESLIDAVAAGRLSAHDAQSNGYRQVPLSTDLAPPQLAVRAAGAALDQAGVRADELGLLAHAWTYYQGHDFWSPAHYVAAQIGAPDAQPVGIQQMCNGGAAALETVTTRMLVDPNLHCALVTTADCFRAPGFDRWRGDYGLVYGDGATAAVLQASTTRPARGFELLSLSTAAAPELERMHRGNDEFNSAARMPSSVIDVRRTKKAFLAGTGKEAFAKVVAARVADALSQGLADAGVNVTEPRLVLVPRLGGAALEDIYRPAISGVVPATVVDLGHDTGHLGAGDVIANLAAAEEHELLRPGDVGVALSAGAGFTWTCVVVRRSHDRGGAAG